MDTAGFSDNFDGSEFNAHRSIKTSSENNEGYGGFDNPCLEGEDPPATLPVTQDDIHIETPPQSNGNTHQRTANSSSLAMTSLPVLYTTETGGSKVVKEQVVIGGSNGNVIQTQQTCCQNVPERWRDIERQKPLTQKRIKVLQILSIVAIIFFFPLGIPAVVFAFRLQKTLNEGIMQGNIDKALIGQTGRKADHFCGTFCYIDSGPGFRTCGKSFYDGRRAEGKYEKSCHARIMMHIYWRFFRYIV